MTIVNDNNKIKVYVVGKDFGDSNWLHCNVVDKMEEADLVIFTGGEDVDPRFYGEPESRFTYPNFARDLNEVKEAEEAIALGKAIVGICRGAQLGCVMSGGKLVQHMNHPHVHNLMLYDGTTVQTNSLHHQLQHPYTLNPIEYSIIGWAKGLSNIYLNGRDTEMVIQKVIGRESYTKEPEIVYYKRTNWLGVQGHPEMLNYNAALNQLMRALTKLLISGQLDIVTTMNIPTSRYLHKALEISADEQQVYDQLVEARKAIEVTPKTVTAVTE